MSDSEDGQGGIPLVEDVSSPGSPLALNQAVKRKREDDSIAISSKKTKKQKQKKSKKPEDVDDDALDTGKGINHAIAHMDSKLMADHLAQRTKRFQPDLSLVEVDEWYISGSRFPRYIVLVFG